MPTENKSQGYNAPPTHTKTTTPNPQSNSMYGNQYNQCAAGLKYQIQEQNPGYVYEQKDAGQGQSTVAVINQQSAPTVGNPEPQLFDWRCPAAFACLCCFFPTGLYALDYAIKAEEAAARGDFVKAKAKARPARNLVIASFLIGIICITVVVVVYYLMGRIRF